MPLRWLKPHQHKALYVLNNKFKALDGQCLADDMGLGKTYTALALQMYLLKSDKILVLCPMVNVELWVAEIQNFQLQCKKSEIVNASEVKKYEVASINQGDKDKVKFNKINHWSYNSNPTILVISHSQFLVSKQRGGGNLLKRADGIIVDEAHIFSKF